MFNPVGVVCYDCVVVHGLHPWLLKLNPERVRCNYKHLIRFYLRFILRVPSPLERGWCEVYSPQSSSRSPNQSPNRSSSPPSLPHLLRDGEGKGEALKQRTLRHTHI
jgi:hypothetical protein